jgi:GT2 family glycosyltransferase
MKISILIPVNDYDIIALVHSMKEGMVNVPEFCEILIGDDGSSEEYRKKYQAIACDSVRLVTSEKNIGRASIRNRLIIEACGDFLLFIDADTMLTGTAETYLRTWIEYINSGRVISGGTLYRNSLPGDPDKILRWRYGREKEQMKAAERNKRPHTNFSTFNVMIERSVFTKLRFYEELKQYGHEDTLFSYQLKKAGVNVLHIDNGLIHEGLETNREFLTKTKNSIENLSKLYDIVTDRRTFSSVARLLLVFRYLNFFHLTRIFAGLFIRYRERMERRLDSSNISLKLFEFYKLSMFCTYREIHRRRKILPILNIPPGAI